LSPTAVGPRFRAQACALNPLILFLLIQLIAGCAGVAEHPPRRADRYAGRTMHLLPLTSVALEDTLDFGAAFQATDSAGRVAAVAGLLSRSLLRWADHVKPVSDSGCRTDSAAWKDTVVPAFNGRAWDEAILPRPVRAALDTACGTPDLGLRIYDLVLEWHERKRKGADADAGSGRKGSLVLAGRFVLWDFQADTLVDFGTFRGKRRYWPSVGKSDWQGVADQAMAAIIKGTPMRGPKLTGIRDAADGAAGGEAAPARYH
jgi:hypothetical protein